MNKPKLRIPPREDIIRLCTLVLAFLLMAAGFFFFLKELFAESNSTANEPQLWLYTIGGSVLIAALGALWLHACLPNAPTAKPRSVWACPLAAAGLGLALMSLAYIFLGVYPVGDKSILIVDMHHQYAPLLSELREMFIEGGNFTYSFHVGLGTNFLSCFAYYLASPLNLLLVFFSESQLTEAILFITLLKNALTAAAFAACVQYLFRKRNAGVVASAVMYSLSLYMLAYSWNIMWLDVVALLPIVVMCFERMVREGKWLAYVLTLALALFSNYYIGFMLCVFLVLYFLVWQIRSPRTLKERAVGAGYFAGGSLLGGCLVMVLLLPTAMALGRTSAAGDTLPNFKATFEMFELFGRAFYGATPTIRSGNLPNIYCGVLTVLLIPVYATQKAVPLRRRLSYIALLLVMLVSCTINQWDLAWHGLHSPNDLPYRFSFLVSFVMLLLAARVLTQLGHIKPKQILGSLTASAVYLVLWEKFADEKTGPDDKLLYINLLLLGIYALVLLISAARKFPVRAGRLLLLTVVALELLLGAGRTLDTMDSKEYFTQQKNYVDNLETEANALAVEKAQAIAEANGDKFARIEYLPRSTCVDPALHHYKGLTTFASSNPHTTTLFMGDLGYAINGVNSYLYHSFVAPADSLLSLKYVILEFKLSSNPYLKLLDSIELTDTDEVSKETIYERRYIYENTAALPVGYYATNAILDYVGKDYKPFDNQEALYSAITGENHEIYSALPLDPQDSDSTIHNGAFFKSGSFETVYYSGIISEPGQYFAFVDCRAADSIYVKVFDANGDEDNSWSVTNHEPYTIDLGKLQVGKKVQVSISADGGVSGNIHVVRLNEDAFNNAVAQTDRYSLQVTDSTATSITGTVTAPQDGVVMYSVTYDKGWSATVDGKSAETVIIDKDSEGEDGALLGVKVPAGTHTVEITYQAPGQTAGLVISLVTALIILSLWYVERLLRIAAGENLKDPLAFLNKKTPVPAQIAAPAEIPAEIPAEADEIAESSDVPTPPTE